MYPITFLRWDVIQTQHEIEANGCKSQRLARISDLELLDLCGHGTIFGLLSAAVM